MYILKKIILSLADYCFQYALAQTKALAEKYPRHKYCWPLLRAFLYLFHKAFTAILEEL